MPPSEPCDLASPPHYDPIDSRKLLFFYMIASCGSIGEAARRLHLTRSALSHAVRTLELELGCDLFHRSDRKIILTEIGERLMPVASHILEEMQNARQSLFRDSVVATAL